MKVIALTFFALAAYVVLQGARDLITDEDQLWRPSLHDSSSPRGSFMWTFVGLFWIVLTIGIALLVITFLPRAGTRGASSIALQSADGSPEQIPDRLFAVGESTGRSTGLAALSETQDPT